MKANMGTADRIIRIIVAIAIATLYATGRIGGTSGTVLLVLAVVFVLTSIVRVCPLYLPFGIRTSKAR